MEGFKKFIAKTFEWKTGACIMFTATVIIYSAISFIFGARSVSMYTLLGLLVISAVCSLIQYICFTDNIFKKMKYSIRTLIFVCAYMPILAFCGYVFKWFPTDSIGSWALFIIIFMVFFAIFTCSFEVYYKITGRKYDGLLGQYKKQQEEKNK